MTAPTPTSTAPRRIALLALTLTMEEPGGVTTPAPPRKGDVDAVIDRDAMGNPHIPGTSLAGALRARVEDVRGPASVKEWLGFVGGTGSDQAVAARASRLWVLGSRLATRVPEPNQVSVRWTTAIDRHRGAARLRAFRSSEMLPAGTAFTAYLRLDEPGPEEVADLCGVLAGWRPLLGRGVSSGRGRCAVTQLRRGVLDLSDPSDLLTWVTTSGPDLVDAVATTKEALRDPDPRTCIETQWTLTGPLFVGAGEKAAKDRDDNILTPYVQGGVLTVPGTSLKGVIRSRTEFILRSVLGNSGACLDQQCGRCRACLWFGFGGGQNPDASSVGSRGVVRFPDTTIAPADERSGGPVPVRTRMHVALDRFTGGAARKSHTDLLAHASGDRAGMLYGIAAPEVGRLNIVVDITDLPGAEHPLFTALLRLVLQDLHDGLVGVGGATTRGYGGLRATTLEVDPLPSLTIARATLAAFAPVPRPPDALTPEGGAVHD